MLKLSMTDILLRGLPEGFLFIFAIYVFSKSKIILSKYLLSSIAYAIIVYIIRLLPINYGVNNILGIMVSITLVVYLSKIEILKAIRAVIIVTIFQFLCEGLNIYIIHNVLKKDINYIFSQPLMKTLYGIPSLILFFIITILFYKLSNRKESDYVSNN
ncbi:hypothetical protein SH2C18_05850 [Clostridium sediminicola]|uniref:hypothetical protein n=1 Tax=Clostridium sediminicola TaxID=3114879 RepID=UPI0031F2235C